MSMKSLRGYEYYVTFIDDFSKKTWIYFLKTKDEVSVNSKSSRLLWRTRQEGRLRFFDQIMEASTKEMTSTSSIPGKESRESGLFLRIHIRLEFLRGRASPYQRQQGLC
jgi:hypothetical protein